MVVPFENPFHFHELLQKYQIHKTFFFFFFRYSNPKIQVDSLLVHVPSFAHIAKQEFYRANHRWLFELHKYFNWFNICLNILRYNSNKIIPFNIIITTVYFAISYTTHFLGTLHRSSQHQGFIAAVPNLSGTRDWFHGRQVFPSRGVGVVQGVMRAMGSGRWSFTHSPPAVRPGS